MNTDPTPYDASLMTILKSFMKVRASSGKNMITDKYCLLNLSNTKWSTSLAAIDPSYPAFDMIKNTML